MTRISGILGVCVLMLMARIFLISPPALTAGTPLIMCLPERPTVRTGEAIRLRVWVDGGQHVQYLWSVSAGRLESQGAEEEWDFQGVEPGYYTATVRAGDPSGNSADCMLQVVVVHGEDHRGGVAARSLLVRGNAEVEGFGLYSYVLLASPPSSDATRDRYLKTMESYLGLIQSVEALEPDFEHNQLNVTYLPVNSRPAEVVSPQWLLDHYDYARALRLLRTLPGAHMGGPFIVSSLTPLGEITTLSGRYLYQDLSSVPPRLVPLWVQVFINQAAQERFWEEPTAEKLVIRLRTTIGVLAGGLADVQDGLKTWIAWVR
jgi:hypothetical protein